jgi:NAD(P)-dependent dehydrogenase (short-subunit alcohol dehydrogenase family)
MKDQIKSQYEYDDEQLDSAKKYLINSGYLNATGNTLTPISGPHIEEWEQHLNTNLLGPWLLIQKISQHMIHNSIAGSIINIASINGDQAPCSTASAYCATKAGLIQLTKQLVGELSPHQIRINAISPG